MCRWCMADEWQTGGADNPKVGERRCVSPVLETSPEDGPGSVRAHLAWPVSGIGHGAEVIGEVAGAWLPMAVTMR